MLCRSTQKSNILRDQQNIFFEHADKNVECLQRYVFISAKHRIETEFRPSTAAPVRDPRKIERDV